MSAAQPLDQPLVPDGGIPWHEAWRRLAEDAFAEHAPAPRRREAILWILAVVGALLSFWMRGYTPLRENGGWHLPMLHAMVRDLQGGPSLFPGDPFVLHGDSYHSVLWLVVAHLGTVVHLDYVLMVLYAVQLLLLHYAVGALGFRLARNLVAAGAASVWFAYDVRPSLGGSFFMNEAVSHTAFSVPLLLLAVVMAMDRRWWAMALLWGAGAHVHLPNAVYVAPLLLCVAGYGLVAERRDRGGWNVPAIGVAAGIATLLFAPLVLRFLGAAPPVAEPLTWQEFRGLTSTWVERHIFIEGHIGAKHFPEGTIAQLLGVLLLTFAMTAAAGPALRAFLMGHWLLLLPITLGVLGASVLESKAIARLMLLRAGDFLMVAGLLVQVAALWPWVRGELRLVRFAVPFYAFALYGAGAGQYGDRSMFWMMAIVLAVALAGWFLWHRRAGFAPRVEALVGRLPYAIRTFPPVLALLILSLLGSAFQFNRTRAEIMRAQASWRLAQLNEKRFTHWHQVQNWAANNTPEGTLFLTPFSREYFRLRSFRPCFLDLRDANNVVLGDHVGREIIRRLRAMGITTTHLYELETFPKYFDQRLDNQRLRFLRDTEGVRFAVMEFEHPTDFPTVFFNQSLKIVSLAEGS